MTKWYCDRCKAEVPNPAYLIRFKIEEKSGERTQLERITRPIRAKIEEFCEACVEEIVTFIATQGRAIRP